MNLQKLCGKHCKNLEMCHFGCLMKTIILHIMVNSRMQMTMLIWDSSILMLPIAFQDSGSTTIINHINRIVVTEMKN